ncbi:MAG: 2'-deoxycytidine 5'-triphosphate deaminase [Candidatus Magnetoovum sp. WYHC-5]|nr:2'-deoxycytidine 5'-triphosphate deaminase [Candidatus Magnetoovum sp. WYHC-5]
MNNITDKMGVFSARMIKELIAAGNIKAQEVIQEEHIQPASLDLRLGNMAYQIKASFLPGGYSSILDKIEALDLLIDTIDLTRPNILQKGCVYVVPLLEQLSLPANVSARANPRSTSGRLDVFVRLLTDFGTVYEDVPQGYEGQLYVEIVPRTFSVLMSKGSRLNQLRFIYGKPLTSDTELTTLHNKETIVCFADRLPCEAKIGDGLLLTVNLQGYKGQGGVIGYKAKRDAPILDFNKVNHYDSAGFWETVYCPEKRGLVLNPNDLYILTSKENVRVPPAYAAEMVAFEPSMGEFRVHYAGFFDPGFGYGNNNEVDGTPAVLEVRAHDAPFIIEDGQLIARLLYFPLVEPATKIYGTSIGSSYQFQKLTLSKQFKKL